MTRRNMRLILFIGIPFIIITLIGYIFEPVEQSKPVTKNTEAKVKEPEEYSVDNIKAFAKLYGYIRYFHPSDEAYELDWETFALYGVQQVMNAKNSDELKNILEELFLPIAPTIQIYESDQNPKELALKKGPNLIAWQHYGMDLLQNPNSVYESKRGFSETEKEIKLFNQTLSAGTTINKKLNSKLTAKIPIVLYANKKGSLGGTEESRKMYKELKYNLSYPILEKKSWFLADTVMAWNVIQHFYPDHDVLNLNWEKELDKTIINILNSKNETEYERHFQLMLYKLGDGYIAELANPIKNNYLPIQVDWIQNELLVTASETEQIQLGDRILKINDVDITKITSLTEDEFSGSEQWKKSQALKDIFSSKSDETEISLTINRNENLLDNISLKYNYYHLDDFSRTSKEPLYEIEKGVYYLNQTVYTDVQFRQHLEELASASGLIVDLRGYPDDIKLGKTIISHLIETPVQSPMIQIPKVIYPDHEKVDLDTTQWTIEPSSPKLPGKIVFLTYGGPIGESEMLLEMVKHDKLGVLIGQPTAGENGGTNIIQLLGEKNKIYWTGARVLKHNGSPHHLIGIKPDITVNRTMEAVKQGRDEYIEKALEFIHSN